MNNRDAYLLIGALVAIVGACHRTVYGDNESRTPAAGPTSTGQSSQRAMLRLREVSDYRRTIVLIYGETAPGQDLFARGGLDHDQARKLLGKDCTSSNYQCAIPIRHLNSKNVTTQPWKLGDSYLDWYGNEPAQTGVSHGILAQGSALDWTTNYWPAAWGAAHEVAVDGFGIEPLNRFGMHYWMLDVSMDCSRGFQNGDTSWFELKTYVSNQVGWESDINQAGTPYASKNHFCKCGMLNVLKRGDDQAHFLPIATSDDPVLAGAGDIAFGKDDGSNESRRTAELLDTQVPTTAAIFVAGDAIQTQPKNAQDTKWAYNQLFNPTWGRHLARLRPSPGNHDFWSVEEPYYEYFGTAAGPSKKGYYSYDLGSVWHVVVLNANDAVNSQYASRLGPELDWLQKDLDTNRNKRIVAYWHQPLFSSGHGHGGDPKIRPYWDKLYQYGNVEVVINGHDHIYERFARQSPSGQRDDARGIREFIVGTGGMEMYPLGPVLQNSEIRQTGTWGVLKLTLHDCWYEWTFIPVAGGSFVDSGSTFCH